MENRIKRRSANFTVKEENILLSLVSKYKEKVDNKKSDTNSSKIKVLTWMEIANEFNGISDGYIRDFKVLRMKYENLKKRAKLTNTLIGEKPFLPEQFPEPLIWDTRTMDLEELKKKCFLEEHDLRLKMIQAEIKHKEQEHQKRMRILDLEEEVHKTSLEALQVQMKSEMGC